MKRIDVAITAWPNHPARLEFFRVTLRALRLLLTSTDDELRYFCSAESERDPESPWCGDELAEICREYDTSLSWRSGSAGLGENMNAALRMCSAEFVLLVQDDYWLKDQLNLSPAPRLLETGVDLVRFRWPEGLSRDGSGQPRCILKDHPDGWRRAVGNRVYGDDPHLRRRDMVERFGPYLEGVAHGISESDYCQRLLRMGAEIAVADRCYFDHAGGYLSAVTDDVRRKEALGGKG